MVGAKKRSVGETSVASVALTVKGQDGNEVFFRIKRSARLQKLLMAYCERKQLDYRSMEFLFNGERIPTRQSPDDLKLEDGDQIDAMKHHTGGGYGRL
ncbi:unnamed protein product [Ilex paraguariensis]|uniref:Ubiquitin-like domain-containing protein n=1 Tax=Ilex paraguariensis TaxID=185542 RepID=A0ABC8R906_9AQUA